MPWKIEISEAAKKSLAKINKRDRQFILQFLTQHLPAQPNLRSLGKALQGNLKGL